MTALASEPCRRCGEAIIMAVTTKLRRVAVEPADPDHGRDDLLVMLAPLPKTGYPEPRVLPRGDRETADDHVLVPAGGSWWQRHACVAKGGRRA